MNTTTQLAAKATGPKLKAATDDRVEKPRAEKSKLIKIAIRALKPYVRIALDHRLYRAQGIRWVERTTERASERPSDRASDRATERPSDRPSDRVTDRATDRATEENHNSSSRRPFETLTSAFYSIIQN